MYDPHATWTRLPLAGVPNARELGGYPVPGGSTQFRRFVRSDSLNRATESDLRFLYEYGVRSVIDLRDPQEDEYAPDPSLGPDVVCFGSSLLNIDISDMERIEREIAAGTPDAVQFYRMMLNNRIADLCLTVALSGFCALFAACFINYGLSAPVILPAIYQEAPTEERAEEQNEEGTSKLEQWIRNKGYLNNETAIVEIARQSDLTVEQFHRYFRDVVGEDFRTWRLRRRIDEAKLLMTEQPELPIIQIVKMIGFNDRSFFYKQFLRFTGESVLEYRRRLK